MTTTKKTKRLTQSQKWDNRKTFWGGDSPYQAQHEEMHNKFVPSRNEVNFEKQGLKPNARLEELMEAHRGMTRLYYDFFNNGGWNAMEVSYGEYDFSNYYEPMVDNISNVLPNNYYSVKSKLHDIFRKQSMYDNWATSNDLEDIAEELHKMCWEEYQKVKDDYINADSFNQED